ncbi:hypothetical protein Holit_02580 [Hollandina sp. SP2]
MLLPCRISNKIVAFYSCAVPKHPRMSIGLWVLYNRLLTAIPLVSKEYPYALRIAPAPIHKPKGKA